MGASSSKATRAAGAAARKYPTRTPPTSQPSSNAPSQPPPPPAAPGNTSPGPTVRPEPTASSSRSEAINLDASDPDFAKSLRSLGPVQPNPTLSQTSTFSGSQQYNNPINATQRVGPDPRRNPAIAVLEARSRLQDEAEKEFMDARRRGHAGRQFLDVLTIRQMLVLRDEKGQSAAQIEKTLGLKQGTVERLGPKGVASVVAEVGRAQKGVDLV